MAPMWNAALPDHDRVAKSRVGVVQARSAHKIAANAPRDTPYTRGGDLGYPTGIKQRYRRSPERRYDRSC